MQRKPIMCGFCFLVAVSLLISACSPQKNAATEVPTIDTNIIYTQAAETVQAGQALTEAAKPPTQTPTEASEPTATMDPAISTGLTATANAVLVPGDNQTGLATATPESNITPLVIPTATKGAVVQPPPASDDLCEWVKNSPPDGAEIPKNASFDALIRVKNTGKTTWDSKYALRYFGGDRMGVPSDFYVQGEVKPNATYDFNFTMKAPDSTGKKEVLMVVQNSEGRNMCFVNIPLEITN